jgi:hypothetical protein
MSVASKCRAIMNPYKRSACYQKEMDEANKDTDVYGLNKYTQYADKNSPLAKMTMEELIEYAKTHLGGKSRKRKIRSYILKSKSKKSLKYKKKITKRSHKLKNKKKTSKNIKSK